MKKNTIKTIVKIAIAVALIAYFLLTNDMGTVFATLGGIDAGTWAICCGLILLFVAVGAVKWRQLIPECALKDLLLVNYITGFYTLVLPGQLASEVVKAYILGRKAKNMERVSASVLVDKMTGLIALLLLGSVGVLFSRNDLGWTLVALFIGASVLMIAALYLVNIKGFYDLLMRALAWFEKKFQKGKKITGIAEKLLNAWRDFSRDPKTILKSIALGLVMQFIIALSYYLFSRAIGVPVPLIDWLWIEAGTSMALLLPITIGGVGVREGTLVGFLGMLGVAPEQALVISFGLFALMIFRAIVGGALELRRTLWRPAQ